MVIVLHPLVQSLSNFIKYLLGRSKVRSIAKNPVKGVSGLLPKL
jgi:hypothetical protein